MAKNITLMGANYPDVPAVQLPQTGGGTATFYDIGPNTKTEDGIVTKGQGNENKVWGTDGQGNPGWMTYVFTKKYIAVTTSGTGAVQINTVDTPHRFVGALITSGGPGFVFRRDNNYFTVLNNSMQPLANTTVSFDAYFAQMET